VLEQLIELRRHAGDYLREDGLVAEDRYFLAEQNAAVVANAEEYYRTMFGGPAASWSLRDRHMADTLDQLQEPRLQRAIGVIYWPESQRSSHWFAACVSQLGHAHHAGGLWVKDAR
jgi:erythromycin esterase-like protein